MDKKETAFRMDSRELASRIYVDLVGRSVALGEGGVTMSASAENIARLSFKLSAAFQRVEDQLNAENLPKNQGFTVDAESIAEWSK